MARFEYLIRGGALARLDGQMLAQDIEQRDRDIEQYLSNLELRLASLPPGGLNILGRVPTVNDLPLPPPDNNPGDAYLTDDPLDHLWVWIDDPTDPPARWLDTGPFNVTDHNALADVTPNQHHPQLHDLDSHTDVNAPGPVDAQALVWDAPTSKWVAGDVASGPHVLEGPADNPPVDLLDSQLFWDEDGVTPFGSDLGDLVDVSVPTPADGQALVWDDTTSKWVAGDVAFDGTELLQSGKFSGTTGNNGLVTVSFDIEYATQPNVVAIVMANATTGGGYFIQMNSTNETGFNARVMSQGANVGSGFDVVILWVAVGAPLDPADANMPDTGGDAPAITALVASGTFTGTTNTSGALTVQHGLGWTPDSVVVAPRTPDGGNMGDRWTGVSVGSITDQDFKVQRAVSAAATLLASTSISGSWIAVKGSS